jgi:AcrR family transcriptional regulator
MLAAMTSAPLNIAETSDNTAANAHRDDGRSAAEFTSPGQEGATAGEEGVRPRKRGAELEEAIRCACVAELAESGYGGLTIESVAARAQTGKASIYRRWPTKQELVRDSLTSMMSGPLMRLADRTYDDTMTTRDALLELLSEVSEFMLGPEGDAMRSMMGESLRDETFTLSFRCDFFDPRKQAVLDLLQRGIRRGEVRTTALDDVVPEMIGGLFIHRILLLRQRPSRPELERILDGFIMPAIRA